jgi:hypothetical protein
LLFHLACEFGGGSGGRGGSLGREVRREFGCRRRLTLTEKEHGREDSSSSSSSSVEVEVKLMGGEVDDCF